MNAVLVTGFAYMHHITGPMHPAFAAVGANVSSGIGAAAYVVIISAIYKRNLKPALGVLGNISIGGAIERALNFTDKVSILSEKRCQDGFGADV
jgi:hypothetical protein